MLTRLKTLIIHDARLQFRYGIYAAYGFVVAFYIGVLIFVGGHLPDWITGLIIFSDPAVLGFFFLGALMLLEKGENTRQALGVAPIGATDYVAAKAITLTLVALIAVAALVPFVHADTNLAILLPAVVLASITALGVGIPAALYFKSVTSYLIGAAGFMLPIIGPGFVALIEPMPVWAYAIPTAAQFKLILISTGSGTATGTEIVALFTACLIGAIASMWVGIKSMRKELGGK